jgi:hypothetical protein
MSVSSCRAACFLSSRISSSFCVRGLSGTTATLLSFWLKVKLVLAALVLCAQAACVSAPPTRSTYKTPGLSPAQTSRIYDECLYEAKKATASTSVKTSVGYRQFELYNMCLKLKGVTYVGDFTMPDEKWKPILEHCKAEARLAVAGRPVSRQRDELQENLEVACYKQQGVVYHR